MTLYYITDRCSLGGDPLLPCVERVLEAGVDLLQIREKDLSGRQLHELVQRVTRLPNPARARILVNGRVDVALAAGAHGVHLPSNGPSAANVRRMAGPGFLIAVSCHSVQEVCDAEREGADLTVFGPVFETPSKQAHGPPQGLEKLREACSAVEIPVLALGGITLKNAPQCLEYGASGFAAIRLFQRAASLMATVAALRALPSPTRAESKTNS